MADMTGQWSEFKNAHYHRVPVACSAPDTIVSQHFIAALYQMLVEPLLYYCALAMYFHSSCEMISHAGDTFSPPEMVLIASAGRRWAGFGRFYWRARLWRSLATISKPHFAFQINRCLAGYFIALLISFPPHASWNNLSLLRWLIFACHDNRLSSLRSLLRCVSAYNEIFVFTLYGDITQNFYR